MLFKADTSYTGQLKPKGSGADGNPIIIDMYGTGAKPRIDGEGDVYRTLLLENVEYYEVSNLEITNTGSTAGVSGRMGVRVWANSPSLPIAHHIHLKNLYVHDVNGSLIKDGRGVGINIWCSGSTSRFDDLLIEDCHLVRTDRDGIGFWSNYYDPTSNWNPSTNVVVRGNRLEDIGGDGIVVIGCEGALVEYNTLNGGRMRSSLTKCREWSAHWMDRLSIVITIAMAPSFSITTVMTMTAGSCSLPVPAIVL
ncbi:MAG: right-handed parallel beta-helix repeat-containing protein [Planctomycetota bacterium]